MSPREYGCQICSHVLNRYVDENGLVDYQHPHVLGVLDHRPVPVPATRLAGIRRSCDFGSSIGDPLIFVYRTAPIGMVAVVGGTERLDHYGTRWSACTTCSSLVTARKGDQLIERAAAVSGVPRRDIAIGVAARVQRAVLDSLQPGRTLLSDGIWPMVAIPARSMPKVRDRLATFLRGSDAAEALDDPTNVAAGLDQARLYLIDEHFTELAHTAALSLPVTSITADLCPAPYGLLAWESPSGGWAAASWTSAAGGWRIVLYRGLGADGLPDHAIQHLRDDVGCLLPAAAMTIRHGDQLDAGHPAAMLVVTWLLIGQQFVAEVTSAEIEPSTRRAYQRSGRRVPEVRLVRLRGAARAERAGLDGTPEGRQRTHRWWISGHWRSQPYGPGRALRRSIWIAPHLRGPQGLPIAAGTTVRVLGRDPRQHG